MPCSESVVSSLVHPSVFSKSFTDFHSPRIHTASSKQLSRLLGLKSKSQNPFDILGLSRASKQARPGTTHDPSAVPSMYCPCTVHVPPMYYSTLSDYRTTPLSLPVQSLWARQQYDLPFASWRPNCIQTSQGLEMQLPSAKSCGLL